MFFTVVLLAAIGGFGYLVYKNGVDGAVAIVAAGAAALAAHFSGLFDKFF